MISALKKMLSTRYLNAKLKGDTLTLANALREETQAMTVEYINLNYGLQVAVQPYNDDIHSGSLVHIGKSGRVPLLNSEGALQGEVLESLYTKYVDTLARLKASTGMVSQYYIAQTVTGKGSYIEHLCSINVGRPMVVSFKLITLP